MKASMIHLKVKDCRRIPDPGGDPRKQTYYLLANVINLPCDLLSLWTKTNPRDQKLGTVVAKAIKNSLMAGDPYTFHLKNRGLLMSAKECRWNNKTGILSIVLEDRDTHGIVDGGHTYRIICENLNSISHPQYVRLEVQTGIEGDFVSLAEARNTSVQVKDHSIDELHGRHEFIKEVLKGTYISDKIAYRENAEGDVSILDILSVMYMFNMTEFPDENRHPKTAYVTKQGCQKNFRSYMVKEENGEILSSENPYRKVSHILNDLLELYSYIEKRSGDVYKGSIGNLKCVDTGRDKETGKYTEKFGLKYAAGKTKYNIDAAFIIPLLASFRALIVEDSTDGSYKWIANPFEYFEKLGNSLWRSVIKNYKDNGRQANAVGKSESLWDSLYKTVALALSRDR